MARTRIPIERDQKMEDLTELEVESCSAYYDDNGYIRILGEIISTSREPIWDYKEVQVVVYDTEGDS